ncbi:hypothetical protein PF003_g26637 [Phytophthora fragariae]|nr:hypothetical protein PF003_g26637 [Phytophthora fragariae]
MRAVRTPRFNFIPHSGVSRASLLLLGISNRHSRRRVTRCLEGAQKAMSGRLPVEAFIYSDRRVNLGPENVNMLISLYWDRMEKKSLPRVMLDPATLEKNASIQGDEEDDTSGIHCEAHDSADEDGERYGWSDSSDDEEMKKEGDDEDQAEDEENRSAQATMDDLLDYRLSELGCVGFCFPF